jgi:hypothetical protein
MVRLVITEEEEIRSKKRFYKLFMTVLIILL